MKKKKTSKAARGAKSKPRVYRFRAGFRMPKNVDPQACGERIAMLERKHGHVTDELVLADAESPLSPFHDAFEWDDTAAAHQHRLTLARHLMRSVTVVISTPEQEERVCSAFIATRKPKEPNKSVYNNIVYAMSQPDLRAEVLKEALQALIIVRRKYAELSELAVVFAAIDRMVKAA